MEDNIEHRSFWEKKPQIQHIADYFNDKLSQEQPNHLWFSIEAPKLKKGDRFIINGEQFEIVATTH